MCLVNEGGLITKSEGTGDGSKAASLRTVGGHSESAALRTVNRGWAVQGVLLFKPWVSGSKSTVGPEGGSVGGSSLRTAGGQFEEHRGQFEECSIGGFEECSSSNREGNQFEKCFSSNRGVVRIEDRRGMQRSHE